MAQRGDVEQAQLRERERLRREREADVRVRELGSQAPKPLDNDLAVIERRRRQARHGVPRRVRRHFGIEIPGHEAEVGGRQLPAARVPRRVAPGLELLEVGELADVDLGREMPSQGLFERLAGLEEAAGEGPAPGERIARPLPQQDLEQALAHLEDDGKRDVSRGGSGRLDHGLRLSGENLPTALAVALAAGLLLAGCGGGGDGDEGAGTTTQAESDVRVALVTDIGQLSDRGFNQLAFEGLKRAGRELGIETRVVESKSTADYVPNYASLARQGFDLIIGVGFAQGDAIDTAAARFPNTKFAIVDVDQTGLKHTPSNLVGLLFKEQEAGFLAGYLAGLEAKRENATTIGSVGGFKEPPVDRFIAGYQAGAMEAMPGIETLNGYSSDWDDQAKCKELALNQIARGAQIVFQVAGGCGLGALDAAREKNVWGIGVDADQSFLGPHVLTSALKRVDQAVFETIQTVVDDSWQGGRNLTFGLGENGVGLGKISSKVPQEDLDALENVKDRIRSGEISVPTEL